MDLGKGYILDMCGVNTDVAYYLQKTPEKNLTVAERENNHNYLESCLHQRQHFPLFFISVYCVLGTEAEATLKRLAGRLATKWMHPYSSTCGYVG